MADAEDSESTARESVNDGYVVAARFTGSVKRWALERVQDRMQALVAREATFRRLLGGLYEVIAQGVILETVHQLEQDGFCSFFQHRMTFDPAADLDEHGNCEWCGKAPELHELERVCPRERGETQQGAEVSGRETDEERRAGFYWVHVHSGPLVVAEWRPPFHWYLPGTRQEPGPAIHVVSGRLCSPLEGGTNG